MDQDLIIALLAAVSVAEFIALLIAWRRLRGYEDGGTFTPGKDCLLVTYYFLDAEQITNNKEQDLENAEKVQIQYPIEGADDLISVDASYEEKKKRRIHSLSPPPSNKTLIAIDATIVYDCNTGRK